MLQKVTAFGAGKAVGRGFPVRVTEISRSIGQGDGADKSVQALTFTTRSLAHPMENPNPNPNPSSITPNKPFAVSTRGCQMAVGRPLYVALQPVVPATEVAFFPILLVALTPSVV